MPCHPPSLIACIHMVTWSSTLIIWSPYLLNSCRTCHTTRCKAYRRQRRLIECLIFSGNTHHWRATQCTDEEELYYAMCASCQCKRSTHGRLTLCGAVCVLHHWESMYMSAVATSLICASASGATPVTPLQPGC